jgi:hypothetical protein
MSQPSALDAAATADPGEPLVTGNTDGMRRADGDTELATDVFEALVCAWADLLVADYRARHDSATKKQAGCEQGQTPYHTLAPSSVKCLH